MEANRFALHLSCKDLGHYTSVMLSYMPNLYNWGEQFIKKLLCDLEPDEGSEPVPWSNFMP